ncbi:hypothetical protein BDN70DRAFT_902234 [Pholiota conissans]|uniref:Uncharacterized protein n=1 Tax=Pholiota conissans TaxID=109636 RepID=A0A9P5YKG4_9AGAR|nr:hypothetical protein BDN70DRAFT_902234 [Pholiota conissans]
MAVPLTPTPTLPDHDMDVTYNDLESASSSSSLPPNELEGVVEFGAKEMDNLEVLGEEIDDEVIPETPPKAVISAPLRSSDSELLARANIFLKCYNMNRIPEIPQSPPMSPTQANLLYDSSILQVLPAPRRNVNLRPFWQSECTRISALLSAMETKLGQTEYQLYLANKEIARLKEFGGDTLLALAEIARQRAFMEKMGALLTQGRSDLIEDTDTLVS